MAKHWHVMVVMNLKGRVTKAAGIFPGKTKAIALNTCINHFNLRRLGVCTKWSALHIKDYAPNYDCYKETKA